MGLRSFLRELVGFPRQARYTIATRGVFALVGDVMSELSARLRRGSLNAAPAPPVSRGPADFRPLHLPQAADPAASIVIPVFNGFHRTHACVASILEHSRDVSYEVIVIDDGSTDETTQLERWVDGVLVVRSGTNDGFIASCNRGAAAARGQFLVFLNNDTLVSQGWLARLLGTFDAETRVGLVGAKLIYPDGRLQEAGGIVFSDGSCWNYGRRDDVQDPRYGIRGDADYCSGACLAIRRDLFHELGGFDPRYSPMYYEDVDLAFAVRAAGWRVMYQPECQIVHFEGGAAGTDRSSGAKRHQYVNQRTFVNKWADALARQPPPGRNPDIVRHGAARPRR